MSHKAFGSDPWSTPMTKEEILALQSAYQASTPGMWFAEIDARRPIVSNSHSGLRSVLMRADEHELCPEHGGSALGNALFVARAHLMMPFLLDCVALAARLARGDESAEILQTRARWLLKPDALGVFDSVAQEEQV